MTSLASASDIIRLLMQLDLEDQDQIELADLTVGLGLYPIVTSQYSSTTLYQVSYHIQ